MANEQLLGGLGGAMTGAGAGAPFGPYGIAVGAGLGLIGGLMQGRGAQNAQKAYQRAEAAINPMDPQQVALLGRLRQQERMYRAGNDAASGFAKQGVSNALSQTQANLQRAGAGGVSNLLRAQNAANQGFAQIGAGAAARADQMLPLQAGITGALAERQYQRAQQNRAAALARAEQSRQDIYNSFAGGLSVLPGIATGLSGFGQYAPSTVSKPVNNSKY